MTTIEASFSTGQGSHGEWAARTAGTWGNSLRVEICPSATAYEQDLSTNNLVNQADVAVGDTTIVVDDADASGYAFNVGDLISFYSDTANTVSVDDFNEYEVTAINTSTNALTIRLKDDPCMVLVYKLQFQTILKLKDAGNMLIYFKVLQAHQTIIQTMVVVQVMNYM